MFAVDDERSFYHVVVNLQQTACGIRLAAVVLSQQKETGLHLVGESPAGYSICERCRDSRNPTYLPPASPNNSQVEL